jgi:hypothetical protein
MYDSVFSDMRQIYDVETLKIEKITPFRIVTSIFYSNFEAY